MDAAVAHMAEMERAIGQEPAFEIRDHAVEGGVVQAGRRQGHRILLEHHETDAVVLPGLDELARHTRP